MTTNRRFKTSLTILQMIGLITVICTLQVVLGQDTGILKGTVLQPNGDPVHHATVMVVQTGETVEAGEEGGYEVQLGPGTYDVFAYAASYTSQAHLVRIEAGETTNVNLVLHLSPLRETVTVTASGRHQTTFEAIQSVTSLDAFELSEKLAPSIGEVLDGQPGVAKRSFGPGSSRPVVRGFDGDRVLVMKDGMRVGSLGSQSGDHGEPIDPGNLERIEVVKGPATLLYGSNALGGVINAISRHHEMHKHRHEGVRGQATSSFGSNNGLAGAGITAEYGIRSWMVWAGGGGQQTGDYSSPKGSVANSESLTGNASAGLGWFGDGGYLSFGYGFRDGRYGIPFAADFHTHGEEGHDEGDHEEDEAGVDEVDVDWRYYNVRLTGGLQSFSGPVEGVRLSLNFADWKHNELELFETGQEQVGTSFRNKHFVYRGDFDQAHYGRLTGTFGFWGLERNYKATGEEALSPPVEQTGLAIFALEEVDLERAKLQLGARFEHISYSPEQLLGLGHSNEVPAGLPQREFNGVSLGSAVRIGLWADGALVGNFTSSFRAPGLEELYNFGPHVGNLAFEIGNAELGGERSTGFDLSLRHSTDRLQGGANFFLYVIDDFIFGAPTGQTNHGLFEVEYLQRDSRFFGAETNLAFSLHDAVWLNLGMDLVEAELSETGHPLPRIPPLRGYLSLDFRFNGISLSPELKLVSSQDEIFANETPTSGYGLVNLKASCSIPQQHVVHHLSFQIYNLGDKLYRNHLSFIKELAPEMGRGIQASYALKFF